MRHLTVKALAVLYGHDPRVIHDLPSRLACGHSDGDPPDAINEVEAWEAWIGRPVSIPTCPECAVSWDVWLETRLTAP